MGERWRRIEAIAPVSRVDVLIGGDPWAELDPPVVPRAPASVVVSRVALRALYAPGPEEVDAWPMLPEGGVVTEIRSRP
jgi:hypothetical protein